MLQISIIVFREILEIAIIIGILITATKDIKNRSKWILGGVIAGIFACSLIAFFTNKISESFDGMGQEIFNGAVLLTTATMISWTVLWIKKHARTIAGELHVVSNQIKEGNKSLIVLAVISFFTMLREGAEIVLFTYSSYLAGNDATSVLTGLGIGIICGLIFGIALYLGMLRLFGRYFLTVTSWLLIFVACGLTAQAIGFWVNADLITFLTNQAWDSSGFLAQDSFFGKFLHIFFGYIDQPSIIQILFYLLNLGILVFGFKIMSKKHNLDLATINKK